jgi:thiosulfate/3-mercaptopyruvate sulfurtransferase
MTPHLLCTALLMLAAGADAKSDKYPHAELLIDSSELAKAVPEKKAQLLDTRAKAKYDAGHIPGAVWVDVPAWSKAFAAGPDKQTWVKLLGADCLDPAAAVVVYGDDVREVARAWWILRYWGFKDARLLNGGWAAWKSADGAVSREEPGCAVGEPKLTADAGRLATKDQVIDLLKGKDHQIVDARSEKEYCGEQKMAKRGGSIPGAKNLEWSDLLDKDGRFKSADELRKLFKEHDVSLKEPAVTYCQSGGRASVLAFALELMGAKDVRNYYRSWNEWGNDPDTPVVTPKK